MESFRMSVKPSTTELGLSDRRLCPDVPDFLKKPSSKESMQSYRSANFCRLDEVPSQESVCGQF